MRVHCLPGGCEVAKLTTRSRGEFQRRLFRYALISETLIVPSIASGLQRVCAVVAK